LSIGKRGKGDTITGATLYDGFVSLTRKEKTNQAVIIGDLALPNGLLSGLFLE